MGAEAERAVGLMKEISAGMRGCVLLDAEGTALAVQGYTGYAIVSGAVGVAAAVNLLDWP